ncbi:MAG: ABC transporter permease [Eubacteriales bacterium]|nr:ABC transporter permease [Eubacteriales bacterium]
MRPVEILRSVFLSVTSNKFRVFLTSLGIIIGTFTIILVVGIGKAGEAQVADQYSRLSVESITIARARGSGVTTTAVLSKDEALAMPESLQNVESVGVSTRISSEIAAGAISTAVTIQGINEAYADITHLEPLYGTLFTDEDSLMRSRYAVLGYNVANYLFDGDIEAAIDQTVLIKGASFTVVGVLDRIGGSGGISTSVSADSTSADDMAFIPYDVAIKYTSGTTRSGVSSAAQVSFVALANDIDSVKPAITEIQEYIEDTIGSADVYSVTDAGSVLESAQATARTMSALLIAVAIIVLLVSGIGIMNVLMVAVQERTREIGILKSIGAARPVILAEFLLEATFISAFGGLLGAGLSAIAPWALSFTDISFMPSVDGILLGIGFSVITGIISGFYPAVKASGLKPIDALNYE